MPRLTSALALAADGFFVFPLKPKQKTPAFEGWQQLATRDAATIREWWSRRDYNVGIFTTRFGNGKALLVIDVDVKGEHNGEETLLRLELEGQAFPPTREQITPTGGRHLIYVVNEPVKQGAHVLGPGIDIRSRGGYIVGPGSVTKKGEYRWK